MGKHNIEQYSAGYALLKSTAGFWHNSVFYRKIIILGRENINTDHHVIFAPNHQNALMDALAVLFTQKGQLVFLARADIFRKKVLASILYFLKILPVYRIRDGFSSLKGNDEIFTKTIDVIKSQNSLVILPEGDHAGFRRLRQLKKGICRVAFQSDESSGFNLKMKIIPVGVDYSHYIRYRQVLTVVYGKPIEVSEFYDLYKQSPERALNELRAKLSEGLKNVMVHIESEEDYEAIDELRSIVNGKYSDEIHNPKLVRDRELIDKLNNLKITDNPLYRKICELSLYVNNGTKDFNTSYRLLEKKKHPLGLLIAGLLALVITFPLFIYGNIFNLSILQIPVYLTRKIKDPQFVSSVRYALSFIMALLFLPLFLVGSLFIFSNWWISLVVLLSLPISGLFAWNYYILFNRIIGGLRIRKLIKSRNSSFEELRRKHKELLSIVSNL